MMMNRAGGKWQESAENSVVFITVSSPEWTEWNCRGLLEGARLKTCRVQRTENVLESLNEYELA